MADISRRALGRVGRALVRASAAPDKVVVSVPPLPPFAPGADVRLLVGPANFAGQGHLWAQAAARHLGGVAALSFAFEKGVYDFPTDLLVPLQAYRSRDWSAQVEQRLPDVTHVLVEAMRPVTGPTYGPDCWGEIPVLEQGGARVAMVAHGSEVRSPRRVAAADPGGPYADTGDREVANLQTRADRNATLVHCFAGPTFVSTPDLIDDLPTASWLPFVLDVDRWIADRPALERPRPVVLVAATHARFKGVEGDVHQVLEEMDAAGAITLRRVEKIPPAEMPALVASADVVVDQFVVGGYGVAAAEAMAAGRLVLGRVPAEVRARLPRELPLVEAGGDSLRATLEAVLDDREHYAALAREGVAFARELHDGRAAAGVLAGFLGAPLLAE